jgi:mannitol/fructose-specific phosphotransferase system IIA component (Ntr-type)
MALLETQVKLTEILTHEVCVPQLAVGDRWDTIDAMLDILVRTGKLDKQGRDVASKAVRNREETKSTGIGFGVALPHASVDCVSDIVAIVAQLNPAVDFLAHDNEPIRLCVLFLSPQRQFQKHLHALSAFARILSDKDRRERLTSAETPEQMLAVFQTAN